VTGNASAGTLTANGTRRAVVTVGTFDGVHRGHAMVLRRVVAAARERNLRAVLITFDPHPVSVLKPGQAPALLTVGREKSELLAGFGLDEIDVVPFTRELAAYEAERFVDEVLLARFGMRELFVGHDHGFGRGRSGDSSTLERLGALRGFGVHVVHAVEGRDGRLVSSTTIRRAVAQGDLTAAMDGLGRPYGVLGAVERGENRGGRLGFRTINVAVPPPPKLLPPDGVYAVRVKGERGLFGGMLNLGARPTFGDDRRLIEAHLFEADGDWYGESVRVDFIRRLRSVRAFADASALVRQLSRDEESARAVLGRLRAGLLM
jgi:riboflavin kinase/FMN adenylyltransferase